MRKERIKKAIRVAFVTGIVIGAICGSIIGFHIGAGNITLPEQTEPCYAVQCTHYTREVMGGAIVYEKKCCCSTHGHDCPTY